MDIIFYILISIAFVLLIIFIFRETIKKLYFKTPFFEISFETHKPIKIDQNPSMNNYNQNNQFGPNIMNFGPQPRKLNSNIETQLKQMIKQGSPVDVTAVLGDGEAYAFATEIKTYLESQGYKVNGVNQAIFAGPIKGQIIEPPKESDTNYKIIIGNNQ